MNFYPRVVFALHIDEFIRRDLDDPVAIRIREIDLVTLPASGELGN